MCAAISRSPCITWTSTLVWPSAPRRIVVNYSKNTHRHLVEIVERFAEAGLVSEGVISLQTRDPHTLEVVRRRNIKTAEYDKLRPHRTRHM